MNALEQDVFDKLFNEGVDDDFDTDDFEMPDFDEEGEEPVDEMLNNILNGDSDTSHDGSDDPEDDLGELEKEYHMAASAEQQADVENGIGEECGSSEGFSDECGDPDTEFVEPLDPKEDEKGDQMLAAIVTPNLVETTLGADEYDDFVESGEADIAISEGFLNDHYIMEANQEPLGSDSVFMESKFAPEGKKYKMTKSARLKQLYEVSLQIEARLHHDSKYPRMMQAYKIRREIRQEWRRKYGSLAMKRAKRYLKRLMKSKSNALTKVAKRLVGK